MSAAFRVLLVDSDPDDRGLAALILRRELADTEVEEVGDPASLAARLPQADYAAVVSEYRLAWGDGLQVLESVRSVNPDCPVVLFASEGSEAVAAEGLRMGLAGYLVKGSAGYLRLPATVRRAISRSLEHRAAREASSCYQRLTEELALGTFAASAGGTITRANPAMARILGAEGVDRLIGRNLTEFIPDEALQAQVLASMARGRSVHELEFGLRRAGGDLGWGRLTAWPVVDGITGGIACEGAIEDVSGRRQAERELAERAAALGRSNVELQQFAYVISHDLQEPLQLITRYARLLAEHGGALTDEEARRHIGHLIQCSDRMQVMIDDVLTYARVDTQASPFAPVDFADVVKRALANLHAAVDESGAQVSWERLPVMAADGSQMVQVFQNLIGNAVKFRREKPVIRVFAVEDANRCTFAVADNGIGIPSEQLERIFGMFQRLHTTAEYPGTGIGLAICKRIVERHKGRIWVVSQPGQGSTFCFTIPMDLGQESWGSAGDTKG